MIKLRVLDESKDPTPATRDGAQAMVERFWSLKRRRQATEDGAGGWRARAGSTTLPTPPPKILKSDLKKMWDEVCTQAFGSCYAAERLPEPPPHWE